MSRLALEQKLLVTVRDESVSKGTRHLPGAALWRRELK